ncbi:S-layer homology domain-containing protein [Paenibacillus sp. D2_2]|uniref:S-layer homology domain-containing protein n=1 Tax=Paenibacillus sp. D2_2 TaxID=3073092 RepID=UPI0028149DF4|nr:S-layer homology domain-containing protein [Paenibacillus sp. D2_2]WMT41755.1 S-layer homology domain-containing protein [Paenibacillus sp. D2_2]
MPAKPVTITAEFEQDTTRELVSIDAPSAVTGLPNGTAKTADALKLPTSVTLVTYTDSILANVTWDVDASSYDPTLKSDQVFTVEGNVTLPNGVLNTNNIPLTVSIEVAVDAEVVTSKEFLSIMDLAAITNLPNGTGKTVSGLKLPATVEIVTDNGAMDAVVDWDVDSANYAPAVKTEQTFTVNGVVTLPSDVVNTNNIPLNVSIEVTVAKQPVVEPPTGGNNGGNQGGSNNGGGVGTTTPPVTPPTGGGEVASVTTISEKQFDEALATAVAKAAEQGKNSDVAIKLNADAPSDAKLIKVTLSNDSLMKFVANKADTLTVSTPIGAMTFDRNTVSSISKQATGTVTITATQVGDRPFVNFAISSGDKTISKFGGNVTVTLPYVLKSGEKPNVVVAYYINTAGKLEVVKNGKYDVTTQSITFKTSNFSQYAVGYNNVAFADVASNAWYSDAVSFLAAREITDGLGNGNFGSENKVSRAQSLVMIMKAFGIEPDENSENNFSDAGNTYYTGYLAAAKRLGITDGVGNNMFTPEKEVTRQEMLVLTYNTLKSINELPTGTTVKELNDFKDAGSVSGYAIDAMTFFVNIGVISGSNGNILPVDKATRAEFAQILYNIMTK